MAPLNDGCQEMTDIKEGSTSKRKGREDVTVEGKEIKEKMNNIMEGGRGTKVG